MSIKIGILGYGNLGRGVECAVKQNPDMELVAVFTRREPGQVSILTKSAAVCHVSDAAEWKDKIDVLILCGGSATDLPEQTPAFAKLFNVVDSFDTHANIPKHFENVDAADEDVWKSRHYFRGLGSGNVLAEQDVCECDSARRKGLHVLGQGREPGPFGRHPQD